MLIWTVLIIICCILAAMGGVRIKMRLRIVL
jgi:hypothetical protein